jgi:hypothetical protein
MHIAGRSTTLQVQDHSRSHLAPFLSATFTAQAQVQIRLLLATQLLLVAVVAVIMQGAVAVLVRCNISLHQYLVDRIQLPLAAEEREQLAA